MRAAACALCFLILTAASGTAGPRSPLPGPFQTFDLNQGQSARFRMGAREVKIRLESIEEIRDPIRSAIRTASARVRIGSRTLDLPCVGYRLPTETDGLRVACSATRGLLKDAEHDGWGLRKDARIRVGKSGRPYFKPGEFVYPVKQRWFASHTQLGNEPVFVDSGEYPEAASIYYHYAADIGGAEGETPVVAATSGLVVAAGMKKLRGYEGHPAATVQPGTVAILDDRGWFHRYTHLASTEHAVRTGARISAGEPIGRIGKQGNSGGWSHLHYDIRRKMPSGAYGSEDPYPFLWEAYLQEHEPPLIAVARPHRFAAPGSRLAFDATGFHASGAIRKFEWRLGDKTQDGARAEFDFPEVGSFQVVLRIEDQAGNVDFDFADVQILDPKKRYPPTLHTAFFPTLAIKPNTPVRFQARVFRGTKGKLRWEMGDGSRRESQVEVKEDPHADAYSKLMHSYAKSGTYLVRVSYRDENGLTAENHLEVIVP